MSQHKDHFTPRMFHRLLAPSLAYSLGLAFAAMADAIVIGWQMGVTGLAALCFSLPLHTMLLAFVHGLGLGGSTRYARLLAEGKPAQATDCFNRVLQAGLAASVLLAALVNLFPQAILELLGTTPADGTLYTAAKGYLCLIASGAPLFLLKYVLNDFLRSDDNQRLATRGSLYGNAIRIALDLVLVPGLGMGTAGAAGATLIGLSVSVLCYMPALFAKDRTLHLAAARPNPRETLSCLKSGLPAAAPYLYRMVFFLFANHLLLHLEGENSVAVFAVVQSTAYLILYIYIGAAKAAQPLFRTFYGEKNLPAARRALAFALRWGLYAGSTAAALIFLFPGLICSAFGLHEEVLHYLGAPALRLYALSSIGAGVSMVLHTYYRSIHEEQNAFIITLLRNFVILLPCTVFFATSLPQFWWLYPVTELLSLLLLFVWRCLTGRERLFDAARVYALTMHGSSREFTAMAGGIAAFCDRWQAAPRQRYFVSMAAAETCSAFLEQAPGHIAEIQITLAALEDGDFELHIRDNTDFLDSFSAQADRLGGKGALDMEAVGMQVIRQQAKEFSYQQYESFSTLVVRI